MEKEEIQAARTPEADRTAAPGGRAGTHSADGRWILALQRSAGNRAVGRLLGHASQARGVGRRPPLELPLQRKPDGPEDEEPAPQEEPWPEEPVSRPILWPEEAEGERNVPCFDPDSQAAIGSGAASADAAAAHLSVMPPDLQSAVAEMEIARLTWGGAAGANPGQTTLNEAMETIGRAGVAVNAYVEPVGGALDRLQRAAVEASSDASEASAAMTAPASAEEEPEPCFQEGQQAAIAAGVALADDAAAELGNRPPDYPKALATLKNAANKLDAVSGGEPGESRLKGVVARLRAAATGVEAYLTPVETVVAGAAAAVRAASAQAREAADMAKPGPHAAGAGAEPPEAAGYGA